MNKINAGDLIQHSALTSDLTPEQCTELSKVVGTRKLNDGQVLIEEGQSDETLYIVGTGTLSVEREVSTGATVVLHVLKTGDLAGEMGFVDGAEHTATLRAIGETVVLSLRRQDLESILRDKPELVYSVMRGIIRTVHRILRQMNLQHIELTNYITKTHGRY